MKIAIAGHNAGESLAKVLADHLKDRHEVFEVSRTEAGRDAFYANISDRMGSAVMAGDYDRAILVPGIRAALCHDTCSAERTALSNNAQIVTMGARVIGPELAKSIANAFPAQEFDANGRSAGNVKAIDEVDAKYHPSR